LGTSGFGVSGFGVLGLGTSGLGVLDFGDSGSVLSDSAGFSEESFSVLISSPDE
jgi:hypothetical protein